MIAKQASLILSVVAVLVLAGCGGGFPIVTEPVDSALVVRTMQYGDSIERGPEYSVAIEMPSEWTNQLVTRNSGNILKFNYITETELTVPFFAIEALSESQYWQQIGSYPGQVHTLRNTGETFFIASVPRDSFYSSLDDATYSGMVDSLTKALGTVSIERVN